LGSHHKYGVSCKSEKTTHVCNLFRFTDYTQEVICFKEEEYISIKTIDNKDKHNYLDNGTKVALLSTFIRSGFLEDNTTYYYKVTSYNKVDVESRPSNIVSATTKPRPIRPSGFGGESLHVKEIPLFWQPNPEDDIAKYHIFSSSGDENNFSEITSVEGATSYVDKELQDGREYRYKMTAEDKDGLKSNFLDTITIKTKRKDSFYLVE
jgi:hypothetical protein